MIPPRPGFKAVLCSPHSPTPACLPSVLLCSEAIIQMFSRGIAPPKGTQASSRQAWQAWV